MCQWKHDISMISLACFVFFQSLLPLKIVYVHVNQNLKYCEKIVKFSFKMKLASASENDLGSAVH